MKRVIGSYFPMLYPSAYPSWLASRRQNCLADCLALNRLADCLEALDLNCLPDCFALDCPANYLDLNWLYLNYSADCFALDCLADWLDLNCLYLNYFADCFALNGRALACRALYFPAQTRGEAQRKQAIVDQQENLRLDTV
jgi:hypothetical protein